MEPLAIPRPPIALVTGTSSGFGAATAKVFAERGFRVFGTSRSGAAGLANVETLALDVDCDRSVHACMDELRRRAGRIDVLVNNAGRAMVGACEETRADEARALFETNVFGVMRMVAATLPLMRAQGCGSIVNVGSLSGFVGVPFHGVYAASKHALAGYTEALRLEVEPFGIHVCLVEPAAHCTGIRMHRPERIVPEYDAPRSRVEATIQAQILGGNPPERVAEAILAAAVSRSPPLRHRVGGKARFAAFARRIFSARAFENVIRREFQLPGKPRRTPRCRAE